MLQQPEQLQTGRFYYQDGATYDGQYKVIGLPPPTQPEPAKKGAKKKEDEPPGQPAEPPKPVRHGVGEMCRLGYPASRWSSGCQLARISWHGQ